MPDLVHVIDNKPNDFMHISDFPQNIRDPLSTLNSQGFMLNYLHELSQEFVEYSAVAPGPVLDIGTAYGFVVLEALERGAYVIANDLDERHLDDLRKRVPRDSLNRISFVPGHVPEDINFNPNSLGAILASGVLHYLSPLDFSTAIQNIATWLKPNGKFFLATPSPYTNMYEKYLPIFQQSRASNKQWPGYIEDVSQILPQFFTKIPKSIYLVDEVFMIEILEKNGFDVEKVSFFDIALPMEDFTEETNVLGIIARKKRS